MAAQAEFSTSDVSVSPGGSETFALTLINLGNHTETFTLVPSGLLAGWVRLTPPSVTLFGGSQETINVVLRPPRLASTPAGPAPLTVRVIPLDEPDEVIIAETTVVIDAFHDRRLHLLQPVVRSRHRAVYEFLVENQGNSQASCRLHLIDVTQRLDGDFDPPAVGVEPGANSLVRLKMKALRRHWRRGSRTLPFSIEADQQGFPTAVANATFIQTPALPDRIGSRLLAFALVCVVLAGAWFGLLKPLTERAARDAVDEQPPTIVVNTTPANPQDPVSTATTIPTNETVVAPLAPALVEGRGFTKRFEATALPSQTGTSEYTVPAGTELRISDFILQTTNDDGGRATVTRNGEPIQQWDLSNSIANVDPLQLFSPMVFQPGDTITFEVECKTVGGVTGTCVVSLLVSGLTYPSE